MRWTRASKFLQVLTLKLFEEILMLKTGKSHWAYIENIRNWREVKGNFSTIVVFPSFEWFLLFSSNLCWYFMLCRFRKKKIWRNFDFKFEPFLVSFNKAWLSYDSLRLYQLTQKRTNDRKKTKNSPKIHVYKKECIASLGVLSKVLLFNVGNGPSPINSHRNISFSSRGISDLRPSFKTFNFVLFFRTFLFPTFM